MAEFRLFAFNFFQYLRPNLPLNFRLDVPGEHVKPVYLAAMRLKMDRAAAECAKFLASHLDLGSCLEIRSAPGVTTNSKKCKSGASSDVEDGKPNGVNSKERKSSKESIKNGGGGGGGHTENGNGKAAEVKKEEVVNGNVEENGEAATDVDLVIFNKLKLGSEQQTRPVFK